ncbi:MAG: RraA family protein, partial [Planctomycetota bacterium]|nr:RraA family protein [Planctomycetota bacterium]
YCHLLDVGKPVHVGGLDVMTGELMHGDINGVTSIPLDIATEVAEVARQVVDAEKNLLDYLSTPGEKSPDKVATLRNELKDALTQISQDIGGK